jgi:guanine nucleotide exchange protein RalF
MSAEQKTIDAFNEKPKKGLEEIIELVGEEPSKIAEFLHTNHKFFNLHALGELLGELNNQPILNAFAAQMNFENKEFDESLREYVASFRIPGEGQKVDRILEAFGESYSKQNSSIEKDAAYVAAIATIGLNTSLHNPAVKVKPTLETFAGQLNSLTEYNKVQDFSGEFIDKLYQSVKKAPFKLAINETIAGYTISPSSQTKDKIFDQVKHLFGKSKTLDTEKGNFKSKTYDVTESINTIFPYIEAKTATIDKPRSWLKRLTGYEGKITITTSDKDGKSEKVTMQFYQPSVFSKSNTPRLIVQPQDYTKEQMQKAYKPLLDLHEPKQEKRSFREMVKSAASKIGLTKSL